MSDALDTWPPWRSRGIKAAAEDALTTRRDIGTAWAREA
jgi:hypothetical protein